MSKESTLTPRPDDPAPGARWEIIHHDTFDRETPPSTEITGDGLIPGLIELWMRFLYETVQPASYNDGSGVRQVFDRGFSTFTLKVARTTSIEIDGSYAGGGRLKGWVFESGERGSLAGANLEVLRAVALAHAASANQARAGLVILDAAEAATDLAGFLAAIARLT